LWLVAGIAFGSVAAPAQVPAPAPPALDQRLQVMLDSVRQAGGWPGVSLGISLPGQRSLALTSGYSDTARRILMTPADRLLLGSVGKTYVAAIALQLVADRSLDLDAKISRYLGSEPWFRRLPNAELITVRHLMNHTSGLVRYEFDPRAAATLRAEPMKVWTPEERLSLLFDTKAAFAPGEGWDYSDTNYIVLAMILERVAGRSYYELLQSRILEPHGLLNTIPSDRPRLPGVVNGYAGPKNALGGYDASLVNGQLAINPQFEWTGGGIASTASDLARWARLLYTAVAIDSAMLRLMVDGVPARLGPNVKYGLGAMIRETRLGPAWGHSGFFPGYATEVLYFPDRDLAVAIQVNVTDPYPRGLVAVLIALAESVSAR
jgi:D-alanyl-D-alanine carboxypeptidase